MFPQHITIHETIAAVSIINLLIAFISSKYRSFLFWCISRWTYGIIRKTYVHRGLGDAFIAHLMKSGYKSKKFTGELYGEDVAFIRSENEAKHILFRDFHSNTQLFLRKKSWPIMVSGSSLIGKANEVRSYDYIIYSLRWTVDIAKLLDEAVESKNAPEPDEEEVNKFVVKRVSGSKFYKEAQDKEGNGQARLQTTLNEEVLADPFSAFVPYKYLKTDIGEVFQQKKKTLDMMSLTPELEDHIDEIQFFIENKTFYEDRSIPYRRSFLYTGSPGTGKCLGLGTPVLKYDGSIVPVESVIEGDLLMGPDSKPRKVLSTTRNRGELFKIKPLRGNEWICNDVHILTLINSITGEVMDIPLNEYLKLSPSKKHYLKQFGTGVDFELRDDKFAISPYFFGIWLGDGSKYMKANDTLTTIGISKPDAEILAAVKEEAARWELFVVSRGEDTRCPTHFIVGRVGSGYSTNPLLDKMRQLWDDKLRIPREYLTSSRENRLQLLAGLLDTDGHLDNGGFEFVQKNRLVADDVCMLARSLGFRVAETDKVVNDETYRRLFISGDCSIIPMRISRKKAAPRKMNKDVLRTGFNVEAIGVGEYAGFTLDKDGRFLLGDFTITHNTLMCRAIAEKFNLPVVLFDLSSMTNGDLIHAYSQLLSNKLVVFEDIDAVFHGRENITGSDLTFDTFLNVLDGVEKKQGIIHIITTNHPELLDWALCSDMTEEEVKAGKIVSRPGRVDARIVFNGLDSAGRHKLIMRIVRDEELTQKLMEEGKDMSAAQITELAFRAAVAVLWAQRKKDKEAQTITKTKEGL